MWMFFTVVFVIFSLFLYEVNTDVQAKQNREEDERLKKQAEDNAAKKALNDAEDRRLATEKAKFADENRKTAAREKASQNHLTVSQFIIYSSVLIAIAIVIILFFKNINSI